MKTIRLVLVLGLLGALSGAAAPARGGGDRTSIHAILVAASNDKGATDRRLAPYEPTLRRILRFESYRFLGEGSAALAVPAGGAIALGNGHRLELATESSDGKTVRVRVNWTDGGGSLMNTGLALRPGVPAVLGGPARGDKGEVYAVIVIAR
jgi:hypothetical protein